MTDGDKIAAAILAAEASRLEQLVTEQPKPSNRDVAAGVLKLYEYFLRKMGAKI